MLCVGGITRAETAAAQAEGLNVDGQGYYLFLANEGDPDQPIEILAQFASSQHAQRLARLLDARMI